MLCGTSSSLWLLCGLRLSLGLSLDGHGSPNGLIWADAHR
uniref:Uncharacterized protein n=1 Tax=Rhizophora mucronata TaxID=61149 RepID=A0A2P2JYH8_RHIMU